MRGSFEIYLQGKGELIAIIASEFTDDLRIISATKDGAPYPVQSAIEEVQLQFSSKAYAAHLRHDYRSRVGYDALTHETIYILSANNMRTITFIHQSPYTTSNGKFFVAGNLEFIYVAASPPARSPTPCLIISTR